AEAPRIAFPPDGATLARQSGLPFLARVERGTPPFTWLWNGAPARIASHDRQVDLGNPDPGFVDLTVIDARGQSASVFLEIVTP
ncbi:MAG: penicillin-binding protein 1C, partial [Dinoroseobacter sp.]|nr:penicillin-binding protein 1C [Dinoroseobacter sp.]